MTIMLGCSGSQDAAQATQVKSGFTQVWCVSGGEERNKHQSMQGQLQYQWHQSSALNCLRTFSLTRGDNMLGSRIWSTNHKDVLSKWTVTERRHDKVCSWQWVQVSTSLKKVMAARSYNGLGSIMVTHLSGKQVSLATPVSVDASEEVLVFFPYM